jgi:tetratricopeptide (TPR) repeat protein
MSRTRLIALLVFLITVLAYLPSLQNSFLNFDDSTYVVENPNIKNGVTGPMLKWAFTSFYASNWHPLTWITIALDYELFRLNPAGHHLISVLFHAMNACLLLVLLVRLTNRLWPSAFVAALFAWHPLHVESVAWVSEIKDVTSTFWGLLSLLAYVRYTREFAGGGRTEGAGEADCGSSAAMFFRSRFYWFSLVLFALSLLSKPMLVTLPFLMLLLDFWPLDRWQKYWLCLVEKLPFFIFAVVTSVLTCLAQRNTAMASLSEITLGLRIENSVVAYAGYLWKAVWPAHLAILYPLNGEISWLQLALSAVVLAGVSLMTILLARREPYCLVGWLWYLGTLVPVIGLVQVGSQSMADRYTYFPLIGIFLAGTLLATTVARRFNLPKAFLAVLAVLILASCLARTEQQLRYWRNTQTLFAHTLKVTKDNPMAHLTMAHAFLESNLPNQALLECQKALQLKPDMAALYDYVGRILTSLGRPTEALGYFQSALKLKPDSPNFHDSLGIVLIELNRLEEAKAAFSAAIQADPKYAPAHYQMGRALLKQGNGTEAMLQFREALRLEPNNPQMLIYVARVLAADENPRVRNGTEACEIAGRVVKMLGKNDPSVLDTLAAAYAEAGRFDEAAKTQQQAIELSKSGGLQDEMPALQARLKLYQNRQPWRESFRTTSVQN